MNYGQSVGGELPIGRPPFAPSIRCSTSYSPWRRQTRACDQHVDRPAAVTDAFCALANPALDAERASAGTVPFIFDDNRMFAEVAFALARWDTEKRAGVRRSWNACRSAWRPTPPGTGCRSERAVAPPDWTASITSGSIRPPSQPIPDRRSPVRTEKPLSRSRPSFLAA